MSFIANFVDLVPYAGLTIDQGKQVQFSIALKKNLQHGQRIMMKKKKIKKLGKENKGSRKKKKFHKAVVSDLSTF